MTRHAVPRGRAQAGFTLIEVLVALLLLTVGLLATATVYASSRGLTGVSERTTVLAHRAQAEIERISALGWSHVALSGVPTPSADPADPASMLVPGTPPRLRPDRRSPATVEPLEIDAVEGRVDPAPRAWSDGRLRGTIRAWVSWRTDPHCGVGCPATKNAKRITVVVTADGDGGGRGPLVTSVLLTDPSAGPAGKVVDGTDNPLSDPATVCLSPSGAEGSCSRGIGQGSTASWFLHDSDARQDDPVAAVADHALHRTLLPAAGCTLGVLNCPVPDLMGDEPPASSATTLPPLVDRSVGLTGSAGSGGRVIRRASAGCDGAPPTDDERAHQWVTPPWSSGATLRGDGGLTLYTRTSTRVEARVVLCVRFSVSAGPLSDLLRLPPTVLGTVSYELAAWPAATTPVSFTFSLSGAGLTVAAGQRLGIQTWVAASSAADVLLAYGHPTVPSVLQLTLR
jgi:prepilin-type N-terminal cleavage/methylation domain-containing protein